MALVEDVKKGGRYTKKEQEERKLQVYQLHFEENKSAVEIAEILNVNRNTVNDDIKYCFGQFQNGLKAIDIGAKMKKQFHRMEIQRERYFDYLEEAEDIKDKIKLEKLIAEIDNRLAQFYSKALYARREITSSSNPEKDDEEEIRTVVKDVILSNKNSKSRWIFSYDSLEHEFIEKTKCGILEFNMIFDKMDDYGLELCEQKSESSSEKSDPDYDLLEFAKLRGYFSVEEINKIKNNSI
jgi:predicted DNA-binding protein YlxM (UPF0122 family)